MRHTLARLALAGIVAAAVFTPAPLAAASSLLAEFQRADYRDVTKLRGLFYRFAKDIGANPKTVSTEELFYAADVASCLWNVTKDPEEQKAVAQLGYKWALELYARDEASVDAIYFSGLNLLLYSQSKGVLDTLFSLQKVKQLIEKAYAKDPRFLYSSPGIGLGALYLFAPGFPVAFGDLDKAEQYLLEAAKHEPKQTTALVILGGVYAKKGDARKAAEAFEKVRRIPGWTSPTTVYEKDMDFWWHIDQIRAIKALAVLKRGGDVREAFEIVDRATREIDDTYLPRALAAEKAKAL